MSEFDYEAEQELNCLIQSLEDVIEAKKKQKKEYEEFEGCSPGYWLSSTNDRVQDSISEFGNYLGKIIDRRVIALLNKKSEEL